MVESIEINPAAPHHLPSFITPPGETDVLMVVMSIILALSILGFGIIFLRLHTLPERVAHKSQKIQFEIVAVLGLIALFTHMHIFWVAGLLLALIDFPDFGGLMGRIAGSVEKIADERPGNGAVELTPSELHKSGAEHHYGDKHGNKAALASAASGIVATEQKESGHA